MQHWGKVHTDMKSIYEEIATPEKAKAKDSEKSENSAKRVRQAVYDIRYRARRENVPVARAFSDYMRNTSMSPAERSAVKSNISGRNEEIDYEYDFATMQFDEQTGKYKVRVTDKNTGKSYTRYATREKIAQLRSNPNISSVEMTQYGEPYEGEKKKGEQTAKTKSGKGLDPVGKEDGDVDNDGDEDKSDKYLMKRRKAIGKAIESQKEELEVHEILMNSTLAKMGESTGIHREVETGKVVNKAEPGKTYYPNMPKKKTSVAKKKEMNREEKELPFGDLRKLAKKASKRIDANVDGSVNKKDKNDNEMGEFVPTPDGNKKTTRVKESYSSWRNDLIEVMGDKMDDDTKKKIDVMKGKNKIKINPPMKEDVDIEEEKEEKKYCRLCMKKESRSECSYGPKMFDKYSVDDATENEREVAATESNADGGGVSEEVTPQEQQLQRKQLQLNRLKLQAQQKALQKKSKTDMHMSSEEIEYSEIFDRMNVFFEFNEVELELISEKVINEITEYFFITHVEENNMNEEDIDILVAEMTLNINESILLSEETDILNEKLEMVKGAIKSAGSVAKKAVVGGSGLAARAAGTAVRATKKAAGVAKEAGKAAQTGFKRGLEGSPSPKPRKKPKGSVTGKLLKGLGKVASDTGKAAVGTVKKVAGKTARGVSKVSGAVAKKLGESQFDEKLNLKTSEMGEVIKDFQKSDAPQFKGKTKEERRKMALAAKLTADRGGKKLGEQSAIDVVRSQIIAKHGKGAIYDPKSRNKTDKKVTKKPVDNRTQREKETSGRYLGGNRYAGD